MTMSSILEYLFPKKGNATTPEESVQEKIADFINKHTVEMPGSSKMVMIPVDEFKDMVQQAGLKEESPSRNEEEGRRKEDRSSGDEEEGTRKEEREELKEEPEVAVLPVQPATEQPEESKEESPLPSTPVVEGKGSEDIEAMVSRLEELKALLERDNYKDGIIKDLHKEMERLNGNFFEDIRRPMIKSIIAIHRQMTGRLKTLEKETAASDSDYKKLYEELVKNMKFDLTAIGDTMEDEYDLEFFEPVSGDLYNPKEDNAIRVVATDDEGQDGVIQEVLYGGFKNTSTDRIFLKANVIVYKFKK